MVTRPAASIAFWYLPSGVSQWSDTGCVPMLFIPVRTLLVSGFPAKYSLRTAVACRAVISLLEPHADNRAENATTDAMCLKFVAGLFFATHIV
jgi:hypothetical protein